MAEKKQKKVFMVLEKEQLEPLILGDFDEVAAAWAVAPTLKSALIQAAVNVDESDVGDELGELIAVEMTVSKPIPLQLDRSTRITVK